MPKILYLSKAGRCYTAQVIPDVVIHIGPTEPPKCGIEDTDWLRKLQSWHEGQAKSLLEALLGSLPGGVIDELLIQLLKHKAVLWTVPMPPVSEEQAK